MESKLQPANMTEPLNVLLIGNNPIDLTKTLEKINQLHGRKIITEIAFDLKTIVSRLMKFKPNFILIDDNIGKNELNETIDALNRSRNAKNVPITVLKNSNYQESATSGMLDFVLKHHFTAEAFYNILRNSIKFRRTQMFLYKAYENRRRLLKDFYSYI